MAGQAYYNHAYKSGTLSKWTRIAKVKLTAGDFCNVNIVAGWGGSANYALLSVNIYKNPNNVYLHHKIYFQSPNGYKMKYAIESDCFVIYEFAMWDHANCSINYTLGKDVQQVFEATSLADSNLNDFV